MCQYVLSPVLIEGPVVVLFFLIKSIWTAIDDAMFRVATFQSASNSLTYYF